MGDTWITDMTHFLDRNGQVPKEGNSRIAKHLGSVVTALTDSPSTRPRELPVSCRRRPNHKACPGKIVAGFEHGTSNILWACPECDDQGFIRNWQNTLWDKGGRAGLPQISKITYRYGFLNDLDIEDDSDLQTIVLAGSDITDDLLRKIHDHEILGATGIHGDPAVGDPIQVDELDFEHPGGPTRFTLYNRAIMLFHTNEEFYVQVHRVCCAIDQS